MIQVFRSTDLNAPGLQGTVGSVTTLLDMCLVNGYNAITAVGLTSAAGVATLTIFANTTLRTGDWIVVGGATPADYNGTVQVTVVNSTTLTYFVIGTPTSPATGTITYKKAGLGWTIPFTGTNVRAYRSPDSSTNRFYCRVDDSASVGNVREAYARGYEVMTDINTGTGPFPTVAQMTNGALWHKSMTNDGTSRAWILIADEKTFYFLPLPITSGQNVFHGYAFGHFISYKGGDAYNTFITSSSGPASHTSTNNAAAYSGLGIDHVIGATAPVIANTLFLARGMSQSGGSCTAGAFTGKHTASDTLGRASMPGLAWPNGADLGLWLAPLSILDFSASNCTVRGRFPGLYGHMHNVIPQLHLDTVTGVYGLPGATLLACSVSNTTSPSTTVLGMIHVDIAGPW